MEGIYGKRYIFAGSKLLSGISSATKDDSIPPANIALVRPKFY
jgi:hypothetical protein